MVKKRITAQKPHVPVTRKYEMPKFTEEAILSMAADILRPHYGSKIDKKQEEELFERLRDVEGFSDYLKDTLAADLQRHFVASTPMEQFNVRGAFARTVYWRGLLMRKKQDANATGVKRYA